MMGSNPVRVARGDGGADSNPASTTLRASAFPQAEGHYGGACSSRMIPLGPPEATAEPIRTPGSTTLRASALAQAEGHYSGACFSRIIPLGSPLANCKCERDGMRISVRAERSETDKHTLIARRVQALGEKASKIGSFWHRKGTLK